jgi:hypothetical protein
MRIPDCIALGACVYFVYDRFFPSIDSKINPKIKPSSELLAAAIAAGKVAIAENIINGFSNDSERNEALAFRNCHHGKPLGTAVEQGDVPMTRLILSHLPDAEAASGDQCSTIDSFFEPLREKYPENMRYPGCTAASIALKQCHEKSNYPCEELLAVLRKRDVFEILRTKPEKLDPNWKF